jgi:hypothetical protein
MLSILLAGVKGIASERQANEAIAVQRLGQGQSWFCGAHYRAVASGAGAAVMPDKQMLEYFIDPFLPHTAQFSIFLK